jgi:hypothetical protein
MTPQEKGKTITVSQPNITIPENVSEFYANASVIGATDWDFMILFGSMSLPTGNVMSANKLTQDIRIDTVIRMSPQQTKALLSY